MTPQDFKQIEEILDKKLKEQTEFLEQRMGELGAGIREFVELGCVSKKEFIDLENKIDLLEKELQVS